MSPEFVVDICRKALETTLLVAAPMLLSGMIVGLIVSVFQAATQINEQTMTFVPNRRPTKVWAVVKTMINPVPTVGMSA